MIKAYNETPENFESPAQSTVEEMIGLIEKQMAIDEQNELIQSTGTHQSGQKTYGSTHKWHSPSPEKKTQINHS